MSFEVGSFMASVTLELFNVIYFQRNKLKLTCLVWGQGTNQIYHPDIFKNRSINQPAWLDHNTMKMQRIRTDS